MRRLVLVLVVLAVASPCMADGMPIKDGRFDGKVSVLKLTHQQTERLKTKRDIELTAEQKRVLTENAGVAPSVLYIYLTKDGENDCTCCAYNRGLMFSNSQIEVPHEYLVSDKEAAEIEAQYD